MDSVNYGSKRGLSRVSGAPLRRRCVSLASIQGHLSRSIPSEDEERPKTRRVNPQRLAQRLSPDLVAEMEALIFPGAKMPTFAVRKELQERYCVDRRHIYDYFHSRGLRVAKEDKYMNLKRARVKRPQQVISNRPDPLPTKTQQRLSMREASPGEPEPSSQASSDLAQASMPKRATTYPGNASVGHSNYGIVDQEQDLFASVETLLPTQDSPSRMTSGTIVENHTTHCPSDENKEVAEYCYDQISTMGSLPTGDIIQTPPRPDNFMDTFFSSWALDQCNSLYDMFDRGDHYMHEPSHLNWAQAYSANTSGYGSSDIGIQSPHNENSEGPHNGSLECKANSTEDLTASADLAYGTIEDA